MMEPCPPSETSPETSPSATRLPRFSSTTRALEMARLHRWLLSLRPRTSLVSFAREQTATPANPGSSDVDATGSP